VIPDLDINDLVHSALLAEAEPVTLDEALKDEKRIPINWEKSHPDVEMGFQSKRRSNQSTYNDFIFLDWSHTNFPYLRMIVWSIYTYKLVI